MLKHLEIFTFHNRLNRANFWAYLICIMLLGEILSILSGWLFMPYSPFSAFYLLSLVVPTSYLDAAIAVNGFLGFAFIYVMRLGLLIKIICLQISRLHDRNLSGWWLLLGLLPFVGPIYLLIQFLLPSTEGANRFGAAQKPGFQSQMLKKIFVFSCIGFIFALLLSNITFHTIYETYSSQTMFF